MSRHAWALLVIGCAAAPPMADAGHDAARPDAFVAVDAAFAIDGGRLAGGCADCRTGARCTLACDAPADASFAVALTWSSCVGPIVDVHPRCACRSGSVVCGDVGDPSTWSAPSCERGPAGCPDGG